ncbi:MAG: hypothetical protein R2865_14655 [Deinococcales bacterium]
MVMGGGSSHNTGHRLITMGGARQHLPLRLKEAVTWAANSNHRPPTDFFPFEPRSSDLKRHHHRAAGAQS